MVYDVTNKASLSNVRRWMTELRGRVSDSIDVVLVGNKADMESRRSVSAEEGKELADSVGATQFFETSCRSGDNVTRVYQDLAESVMKRRNAASSAARPREVSEGVPLDDDAEGRKAAGSGGRGCC
jgi:Ras-related protein Rab-8A